MHSARRRLLVIVGQEGADKSTIVRALLPHTPRGAQIDADDVGQVNPWQMDEAFLRLLSRNVVDLARNFWEAGYSNVIAGSFINDFPEYRRFRRQIDRDVEVYVIQLCASKAVRDTMSYRACQGLDEAMARQRRPVLS